MTPGPSLIPESEPCVQDCSPSLVGAGTAPITLSKVMIRPLGGAVPTALHPHPRPRRYLRPTQTVQLPENALESLEFFPGFSCQSLFRFQNSAMKNSSLCSHLDVKQVIEPGPNPDPQKNLYPEACLKLWRRAPTLHKQPVGALECNHEGQSEDG